MRLVESQDVCLVESQDMCCDESSDMCFLQSRSSAATLCGSGRRPPPLDWLRAHHMFSLPTRHMSCVSKLQMSWLSTRRMSCILPRRNSCDPTTRCIAPRNTFSQKHVCVIMRTNINPLQALRTPSDIVSATFFEYS